MPEYEHGKLYPNGYWDSGLRAFTTKPPPRAVGNMKTARGSRFDDDSFRGDYISAEERRAKEGARWKPNSKIEARRRLKARNPKAFGRLGPDARMSIGTYEAQLQAYLDNGGELPEGVRPPEPPPEAA